MVAQNKGQPGSGAAAAAEAKKAVSAMQMEARH